MILSRDFSFLIGVLTNGDEWKDKNLTFVQSGAIQVPN